jgi:purine-binding chemotaxis protein CheW
LIADTGDEHVGVVVDVATEVLRVPVDAIEPPSPVVTGANSAYLAGVAKVGERLILLLDFRRLFAEMHRG